MSTMEQVSESRLGKLGAAVFASKHRTSRQRAVTAAKKAQSAAGNAKRAKDIDAKLNNIADSNIELANALMHLMEMSGHNISVGLVTALTAEDAGKKAAKTSAKRKR